MRKGIIAIAITSTLMACSQNSSVDETANSDSASQSKAKVSAELYLMHEEAIQAQRFTAKRQRAQMIPAHVEEMSENYAEYPANPVQLTIDNPVSTFSIDVDTSSYSNVRRMLNQGVMPPAKAVRTEELVNYFNYDYPAPDQADQPFNVSTELSVAPWNKDRHLLRIGLKGLDMDDATTLPPANLVFLVDVSGSMHSPNKLPLVKRSLRMLASQMRAQDTIALVVYAGAAGTVLEPTSGKEKHTIYQAIDSLEAGGSTNGEAGIKLAYQLAEQSRQPKGINRIILCSDGDLNVGTSNVSDLKELVERKRKSGTQLTTLSFGTGNYNDELMEQIADAGNGQAAYIDTLMEAKKVLVDELGGTLHTIAKDVKIQVEFNPATVKEYRLIGYENRILAREDFNNDKVDAGEIGAGHTVTALYELTLVGAENPSVDPLRYGNDTENPGSKSNELSFIKLRYKLPDEETSRLLTFPVNKSQFVALDKTSDDFKHAAAVASFAEVLKGGTHLRSFGYDEIISLAKSSKAATGRPLRSQFIELVELAKLTAASGA
ncbi:VWA domain-containing protein [Corallincola platygyrae]|uniref:VWA domain-containing protein n=1 Tax=Corallincola platygyrae TaxID=1193278 RepID=A0ABW4XMA7_9GAMM